MSIKYDLEQLKQALRETTRDVESAIEEFQGNVGSLLSDLRNSWNNVDGDELNDEGRAMLSDVESTLEELETTIDGLTYELDYDFDSHDFDIDDVITKLAGLKLVWKVTDSTTELENIKTEIELLLRRSGVGIWDYTVEKLDEDGLEL